MPPSVRTVRSTPAGENGVQVCRQHQRLSIFDSGAERENVALGVLVDVGQACLGEKLKHSAPSSLLAERRSSDLCETDLVGERLVVRGDDVLVRRSDVFLIQ